MTTDDPQGQVARSAAVERELREQIGKLREELAEARRHAREYRELYEEAEPRLRAALAEARGALREARKAIDRDRTGLAAGLNAAIDIVKGYHWLAAGEWGSYRWDEQTEKTIRAEIGNCFAAITEGAGKALRDSGTLATQAVRAIDAALARAGKQETQPHTHASVSWDDRRYTGCWCCVDQPPAGEPASSGQEEERRKTVRALATWFRNGPVRALLNTYVADQIQRWAPAPASSGQDFGRAGKLGTHGKPSPTAEHAFSKGRPRPAGPQGSDAGNVAESQVRSGELPASATQPSAVSAPGEQGKGADALARLRAERDRYNETEGESGEMPLLEALDAFLDAEPEQGKGGGEGRNHANAVLDRASHTVAAWPPYMRRPEVRGLAPQSFIGCRDRAEGPCCLTAGHPGYCVATLPIPKGHPLATPPPGEQGKGAPAANPPLSCGHRIGSHALKNGMLECPAQPAEQGKGGGEGLEAGPPYPTISPERVRGRLVSADLDDGTLTIEAPFQYVTGGEVWVIAIPHNDLAPAQPAEHPASGGEGREGEFNPASLDHAELVRLARLGFYGNTSCIQKWRDEGHAAALRGEPAAFWCGPRGHSLFCPQRYLAAPTPAPGAGEQEEGTDG